MESKIRSYEEMKDSGIEWIGRIPAGWEVKAAKYCVEIRHGCDPTTEGDVPVYGSGAESFKTCGEFKEGPAVLVGRKGATLHIPHYITGRYWNVDTAFDVSAHSDFSLKFYYFLATCFDYKFYISQTTLPGMTQTNYRKMPIPVPPLSEQAAIAAYLDDRCGAIDDIITEAKAGIEEYKAWKASVIFEREAGDEYHFTSPALKRQLLPLTARNMPNKLFLATATAWNSEDTRAPYLWLDSCINTFSTDFDQLIYQTAPLFESDDDASLKRFTTRLLHEAKIIPTRAAKRPVSNSCRAFQKSCEVSCPLSRRRSTRRSRSKPPTR